MPPRKSKVVEDVVEYTYKTKIKYICPKRGLVEEEIEIKHYKAAVPPKGTVLDVESLESIEDISN